MKTNVNCFKMTMKWCGVRWTVVWRVWDSGHVEGLWRCCGGVVEWRSVVWSVEQLGCEDV